jgi:hypothetical protein
LSHIPLSRACFCAPPHGSGGNAQSLGAPLKTVLSRAVWTVGGWLANATTHVPHGPNTSNKEHMLISSIDFEALVKQFNVWMVIGAFFFFFFFFFFFSAFF